MSALGFGALALVAAFGAIALAMLLIGLVGGVANGAPISHDRLAWVVAWIVEAAAGAFAGEEIAKRAANPIYSAISRTTAWQMALAAIPPMAAVVALGMGEIGPENPPARVVVNAVMFTAGFPPGGIAGVLWHRRRGKRAA